MGGNFLLNILLNVQWSCKEEEKMARPGWKVVVYGTETKLSIHKLIFNGSID